MATWIPKEYELNLTYAEDKVAFSDYMKALRQAAREDSIKKIDESRISEL